MIGRGEFEPFQPFASTSNLRGGAGRDLEEMVTSLTSSGIRTIELGYMESCPDNIGRDLARFQQDTGCAFVLHNYFPPPEEPFVLNLAASDDTTLELSRSLCRRAIDLSIELQAPFYSVHAGFCFEAGPEDLGAAQIDLQRIDPARAEEVFVESLAILREYAAGPSGILIKCGS